MGLLLVGGWVYVQIVVVDVDWCYCIVLGDMLIMLIDVWLVLLWIWYDLQKFNYVFDLLWLQLGLMLCMLVVWLKCEVSVVEVVFVKGEVQCWCGIVDGIGEVLVIGVMLCSGDCICIGLQFSVSLCFVDGLCLLILLDSEVVLEQLFVFGCGVLLVVCLGVDKGGVDYCVMFNVQCVLFYEV